MWKIQDHRPIVSALGRNADADTGDDLWDGSAAYPFPAAAAATTIVSDSADDLGAGETPGTGARTVMVEGLDANYAAVSETATLNGTTPVNLVNQYLRINRAYVVASGSGAVNAGAIAIKHSSTVIAQIVAAYGQTLQAIYTVPAGHYAWLMGWRGSIDGLAVAKLGLQIRPYAGSWLTKDLLLFAVGNAVQAVKYTAWERLEPKTDIRVRSIVGGNSQDATAGFDLCLNSSPQLP